MEKEKLKNLIEGIIEHQRNEAKLKRNLEEFGKNLKECVDARRKHREALKNWINQLEQNIGGHN